MPGGFGFTFDSEVRSVSNVLYLKIPNLGMFSGDNLPSPDSWVSASKEDIDAFNDLGNPVLPELRNVASNTTKLEALKDLVKDTTFFNTVTEIGKEDINGETTRHYQVSISKEILKVFVSKAIDTLEIDLINKQKADILAKIDALKTITGDFWVATGSYEPRKIIISVGTDEFDMPDMGKMKITISLSSVISKINEPVTIVAPEGARSISESLKEARRKGMKAAMESNLSNLRAEAELFFGSAKSFGKANTKGSCTVPEAGSLFSSVGLPKDVRSNIPTLLQAIRTNAGGDGVCYSTSKTYAAAFPLADDPTTFFCVDSAGTAKETKIPLTGTICK